MNDAQNITMQSWLGETAEQRAANRQALFSFQGRVGRSMYWRFAVMPSVLLLALMAFFNLHMRMGNFGFMVVGLAVCWVVLAVSVKRCHDRGRSGWFLLVGLIPILGTFWLLYDLGFLPGMDEDV